MHANKHYFISFFAVSACPKQQNESVRESDRGNKDELEYSSYYVIRERHSVKNILSILYNDTQGYGNPYYLDNSRQQCSLRYSFQFSKAGESPYASVQTATPENQDAYDCIHRSKVLPWLKINDWDP